VLAIRANHQNFQENFKENIPQAKVASGITGNKPVFQTSLIWQRPRLASIAVMASGPGSPPGLFRAISDAVEHGQGREAVFGVI